MSRPKTRFQIPQISSKTISVASYNIYRSRLNKIASQGITNREEILNNQSRVCEIIKNFVADNKQQGRVFLSAVFYVLADTPNSEKTILYNEFQKYKDTIPV